MKNVIKNILAFFGFLALLGFVTLKSHQVAFSRALENEKRSIQSIEETQPNLKKSHEKK